MNVTVKCFASLAERVGFAEKVVTLEAGATALDAFAAATNGTAMPGGTLTAINLTYASADTSLADGDEVGFFPPVTGGEGPAVEVSDIPFDPWELVAARERGRARDGQAIGAVDVFVGKMRDRNEGDAVQAMTLEHYPGMTERHLAEIVTEAERRWTLEDVFVRHRIGHIVPGEAIVLVAVWAGHRAEAFEACRFIMEDLKSRAPFWKKETRGEKTHWVTGNTPGHTDLEP